MLTPDNTKVNHRKLICLITGIAGIYATLCLGGVLHERLLKKPYIDRFDHTEAHMKNPSGIVAFEKFTIFFFGFLYNLLFITPNPAQVPIPAKNSLTCAIIVFTASLTSNTAIMLVSFPIVIMFKSCNILIVILIGVFCSRVQNKNLRLTGNKLGVALIVSIGIIMFKVFDPEAKAGDEAKSQVVGLACLFVSLMADGFLPDFQAEIKEKFKPQPTVMMVQITKWCTIISLAYCIVTFEIKDIAIFCWRKPLFLLHLILMCLLSFVGHVFIYKMIKEFKQHIVPFTLTTRKIISVIISMVYFKHAASPLQIVGIAIVFSAMAYEFVTQIMKSGKEEKFEEKVRQKVKAIEGEKGQNDQKAAAGIDEPVSTERRISENFIGSDKLMSDEQRISENVINSDKQVSDEKKLLN